MAVSKILKQLFGSWEVKTAPFTADSSGFLYIFANPSTTSGGYATVDAGVSVNIPCYGGEGVCVFVPVKKGTNVSIARQSGVSVSIRFISLGGGS